MPSQKLTVSGAVLDTKDGAVVTGSKRNVLPVAFNDLVAYYPFRQGTGVDVTARDPRFGDATDYSATVNGATFKPDSGVHDIQNGANSGAFQFDGTDDALTNARGLGGTVITILAQINISDLNTGFGRVYSSNPSGGNGGFDISARSSDNRLNVAVNDSSGFDNADTSLTGLKGQFGQVGLRYDGQTLDVIKNGVIADSQASTRTAPQNQAKIGHRLDGGDFERFGGIIDSMRVYDAALSDSQIYQIFKNTRPATRLDSLAARYTYNDGAAQDQTAGVPVSGDSTDYSGALNGTAEVDDGGVNDG